MPTAPLRPCLHQRCPNLVPRGYCTDHARQVTRQKEESRPTAAQRGYGSRWQKARETFLRQSPLCALCLNDNRIIPATVVDHITPHKGDQKKFWSVDNWQSLCASCHSRKTASEDAGFGNPRRIKP